MTLEVINYEWKDKEESIMKIIIKDSCGNKFEGLLELCSEVENERSS